MKKIYFAAPLFNDAELAFNRRLTRKLRDRGFEVFLPQEHACDNSEPFNIFKRDEEAILQSDIFLFILDGRVPDEGACVELGMAYMHKKLSKPTRLIVGLKTDVRVAFCASPLNAIIQVPLDFMANTQEELLGYLTEFGTCTLNNLAGNND